MFRPRHAYKSPITNRYRGKAKGCPVFNNLNEITSNMVEQHDECLECLANIKNRSDLYKTLADNNKPSNNVIKSLQRLSSSASNNRLKTCLQFLIIKVNEKSVTVPKRTSTTGASPKSIQHDQNSPNSEHVCGTPVAQTLKHLTKRQKLHHNQQRQQHVNRQKHNQLASPPQDQVSSTQDQVVASHDDHDCQTSPMMPVGSTINDESHLDDIKLIEDHIPLIKRGVKQEVDGNDDDEVQEEEEMEDEDGDEEEEEAFIKAQTTQSSPQTEYALEATTMTTSTSPNRIIINSVDDYDDYEDNLNKLQPVNLTKPTKTISSPLDVVVAVDSAAKASSSTTTTTTTTSTTTDIRPIAITKRRRTHNSINSDHETSSIASWSSASYGGTSPPSPLSSASSTSSLSSSSSHSSSSTCSSSSSMPQSRSPSPLSSPDIINDLKGPRLKLSEEKIRKIKKRPVLFDDIFYATDQPQSFASTPTASSGCSPGQHSNATQNSDQTSSTRSGFSSLSTTSNMVIHMFQAPPTFVNNLKPCNLPTPKPQEPPPSNTPPVTKIEMLNCAICGIKDKPPNISKTYGQNSCLLCTKFFATFLKRPQQLYCAQDGDCLMTFDSRCQACWIKICLQKFDIEEMHRKVGHKYSPKLLSSPTVSLITIDTSASR